MTTCIRVPEPSDSMLIGPENWRTDNALQSRLSFPLILWDRITL